MPQAPAAGATGSRLVRWRHHRRASDDRRRRRLPLDDPRHRLSRARRPPPHHPALPVPHKRQSRTLHPNAASALGLPPPRRLGRPTHRRAPTLAIPLRLHPTTRQPQPQATRLTTQTLLKTTASVRPCSRSYDRLDIVTGPRPPTSAITIA